MALSTHLPGEIATAVEQVCSVVYQQTFEIVAREQPNNLSSEQRILLTHYPNIIIWYADGQRPAIMEHIRRTNLTWFHNWLSENITGLPPYIEWNSTMTLVMLHATNLLFRIDLGDVITSDQTRNEFQQIADIIKRILISITESNPVIIDKAAIPLVQELLQILFYVTLDDEIVIYLKSLQLVDLMNILLRTSNNDDEIHLHAYRILAVIMAEADIKQLQNSSRIATVFITFIENTIDAGVSREGRLHNSLRSLKVLTQHEQIREELIKQGGHSLFLRCALENQFNPLKAKLPALEILLALAFNNDFATSLKKNIDFMDHVRALASSSQQDLQRVATALIWKIEKEPDSVTTKEKNPASLPSAPVVAKKQYDIMISYSHSDTELCHRILSSLEKDQLNVWIDSRLMHGATFDAMAKAIENSQFVLVCMSDAYKQSPFCEMEASYAIKRRCRVIPLVMTPNYKADGWLGVLTSALIYVDFQKLGFGKAYEELKKQIHLIRENDSSLSVAKQDHLHHNASSLTSSRPGTVPNVKQNKEPRPVVEYPHCIDTWTGDHVKSFLLDKDLDALLPALEGMDGQLLHQTYSMCQANQQGMFLSLKEDVAKRQDATLSLKDYLTFLREIKGYIPYKVGNQLNPASAVCSLM